MAKKTYEVTGTTGYEQHKQGDVFEAELDEDFEERAIERGQLKVTTKKPGPANQQEE